MSPGDAAIAVYGELWQSLRAEAAQHDRALDLAPGPLTAARIRHQADRARRFAAVAHRARYAELLDPEPIAR